MPLQDANATPSFGGFRLKTTVRMSLEEALAFISDDELVEVTPQNLRLRKMELSAVDRKRKRRGGVRARD